MNNRRLILEDGSVYEGRGFGAEGQCCGDLIFYTGVVGFQEMLCEAEREGQLVCFTYPLIGNAGIHTDVESARVPKAKAVVLREFCETPSNFRSQLTFEEWLKQNEVVGLAGIDTRSLTRRLRERSVMRAAIVSMDAEIESVLQQLRAGQLAE